MYEVETRFFFNSKEEALDLIPILKTCLSTTVEWETAHFGPQLFEKDIILRVSKAIVNGHETITLGYKEADIGNGINVRKEFNEIITNGIGHSKIFSILGGQLSFKNVDEVINEINRLGHSKFMVYKGNNLIGKFGNLDFKLMYCNYLKYKLLLEVETEAAGMGEIQYKKQDLIKFINEYALENRMIQKEPPTLLYENIMQ